MSGAVREVLPCVLGTLKGPLEVTLCLEPRLEVFFSGVIKELKYCESSSKRIKFFRKYFFLDGDLSNGPNYIEVPQR